MVLIPEALDSSQQARLAALEAEEPLACAWRYHASPSLSPRQRWPRLRGALRSGRTAVMGVWRPPAPRAGQVVVFSTAATPATFGTLRPILAELRRRGRPAFLVTTPATRRFLAEGLHDGHADLAHLLARLGPRQRSECSRVARELARELQQILRPCDAGDAESWLGTGLVARRVAQNWLGDAGIVVADSDIESWRKGLILGAGAMEIPTVVIQHGFLGSLQFPLHAGQLFTWGDYFSRQAVAFGVAPSRSVAVGCARWDELFLSTSSNDECARRKRLGLDAARPAVLLISNTHGAPHNPVHYGAFLDGVRRLLEDRWQVVVKLHPAEGGLAAYRRALSPELVGRLVVLPPDVDIVEALCAASVVYHVFSAAALEAICLGVPILFERGEPAPKLCDFPDLGGGEWTTPEDVSRRCRALAEGGTSRTAHLERQQGFLDVALAHRGRAAQATTDAIEAACRKI